MELSVKDFSNQIPFVVDQRKNPDNKDYAILFKMENCSWCHKMEPVWEKLNKTIGFMRFYIFTVDSSTENINHWYKIQKSLKNGKDMQGFPMVLMYGHQNKRVVSYPGYQPFEVMKQKVFEFAR